MQEKPRLGTSWFPAFLIVGILSIFLVSFVFFVVSLPCILESGDFYWQPFRTDVALRVEATDRIRGLQL